MDITPFIRDLILLNECVILRGFGGFDTSYKNALLDKNRKIILPPGKKIFFRPEWVKDNGVLEKYLAESLKIKSEKASEIINSYVQRINKKLDDDRFLILAGIGKFQKSENDKIIFTCLEDENYLADSFGLDMLSVEVEKVPAEVIEIPVSKPLIMVHRKFTGWYVTIGVLLFLILSTLYILITGNEGLSLLVPFVKLNKKPAESEVIIFGKQNKALEDSVTKSIEQTIDKRTNFKAALTPGEAIKPITGVGEVRYYLVAGSFKSESNADVLKEKLIKKGITPVVMKTPGNFTMIIVGAFKNRDQAIDELKKARLKLGQSVWLMEE